MFQLFKKDIIRIPTILMNFGIYLCIQKYTQGILFLNGYKYSNTTDRSKRRKIQYSKIIKNFSY